MKLCKTCGKDFKPTFNLKNFCSMECRYGTNVKVFDNKDLSCLDRGYIEDLGEDNYFKRISQAKDKFHPVTRTIKYKATMKTKIALKSWDDIHFDTKRKRIIEDQKGKCFECGIDKWMNIPISLEIDHVNGNRQDNSRENLVALCPNCHSLTKTWRGRNRIRETSKKISDESFREAILKYPSIQQALVALGLAPKGGNYKRANAIKKEIEQERGKNDKV